MLHEGDGHTCHIRRHDYPPGLHFNQSKALDPVCYCANPIKGKGAFCLSAYLLPFHHHVEGCRKLDVKSQLGFRDVRPWLSSSNASSLATSQFQDAAEQIFTLTRQIRFNNALKVLDSQLVVDAAVMSFFCYPLKMEMQKQYLVYQLVRNQGCTSWFSTNTKQSNKFSFWWEVMRFCFDQTLYMTICAVWSHAVSWDLVR